MVAEAAAETPAQQAPEGGGRLKLVVMPVEQLKAMCSVATA